MLYNVQHTDQNVGPASYKEFPPETLLVTNIWHTIQGEGPFAGRPALFVRLAGCNRGAKVDMGCQFCDTSFHFSRGKLKHFKELEQELWALRPGTFIVLTGGEPMMQDNIVAFITYLTNLGWGPIQIESNGDRLATGFLEKCSFVSLVVSPKIVKNQYHPLKREILVRADALKFVVDHRPESPYNVLPSYVTSKLPHEIYLQPLTIYKRAVRQGEIASAWDTTLVDHELTAKNFRHAAKLVKEYGYRVSMQQHLWFREE